MPGRVVGASSVHNGGVDVRRLAAIDMWGTRGTIRRRRIILVEFIGGVVLGAAIVAWVLAGSTSAATIILAVVIGGVAANYVPLAWHAAELTPAGRLEADLEGVDTDRELRRYALLQFWILVPFLLLIWAFQQRSGARPWRGV
jgi:hypothetical protein